MLSWMKYCSSLSTGTPEYILGRLQRIQDNRSSKSWNIHCTFSSLTDPCWQSSLQTSHIDLFHCFWHRHLVLSELLTSGTVLLLRHSSDTRLLLPSQAKTINLQQNTRQQIIYILHTSLTSFKSQLDLLFSKWVISPSQARVVSTLGPPSWLFVKHFEHSFWKRI